MSLPRLSRRTALRGLGTAIALPWLDAMLPRSVRAAEQLLVDAAPRRMAFLYVPNGVQMDAWTPSETGAGFTLPATLEPLQSVREKVSVLTGLTHQKANANGDGGGDHARALGTFLTGVQVKKTDGADIRAGVSVDQIAAPIVGRHTRFASLEIGADPASQSGSCDSGYSCAYSSNISWKSESQPLPKETNPRLIFDRLFSGGRKGESAEARARREKYSLSILDYVREDAQQIHSKVGVSDRRKLDEYLTAVRDVEVRLARATGTQAEALRGVTPPEGQPTQHELHLQLLADLMVLAFQTDSTRVATFVFSNEGSNRSYPMIGVSEGHHELSHHEKRDDKRDKLKKIDKFHITQLAYLLERLNSIREGERTLLDQSLIVYGSGIGDGNAHNHDNLPVLLAGAGGGSVTPGRHIQYENGTPLANLHLSLLERMGVDCSQLGDSNGKLDQLS